jgi:hypothetical protein
MQPNLPTSRRFLVPVDGSLEAQQALTHAAFLAAPADELDVVVFADARDQKAIARAHEIRLSAQCVLRNIAPTAKLQATVLPQPFPMNIDFPCSASA